LNFISFSPVFDTNGPAKGRQPPSGGAAQEVRNPGGLHPGQVPQCAVLQVPAAGAGRSAHSWTFCAPRRGGDQRGGYPKGSLHGDRLGGLHAGVRGLPQRHHQLCPAPR